MIFRNSCFDFTDKIGTNIGSFGVYTTTDTSKECNATCTKTKTRQ